ncbi:ATP synthase F1 subunit delta [Sphingobacterium endophyticum]|uniref:ATP synthase F1 subunit delta n=1 Tax=Sphingobacterium endophyticum TaxID=2546448 RepID=UPI0012E25E1F|nr:ATP synthase F1 subunit delta [Sphingobacterium endophyticum]
MSVFKVASRYAKSLIDLSKEHQNLDGVKADMDGVIAVIKSNTELQAVLNNPIIKTDKKLAILKALFQDKVKPEILEFFNIMVRKGRADLVYATALEFIREYNEVKGIVYAEVTSASPLSEANLQALKQEIASQINAEVILSNKVDKSLIGGFVVKVGDMQIDASIQGKLNKLERHFENQGV